MLEIFGTGVFVHDLFMYMTL